MTDGNDLLALLCEVTSVLAWGTSGKQSLSELPSGTEDIVRAACTVRPIFL